MSKSCVICGSEESEGELLLASPCGRHWICADDVGSFFENATNNESLFPPKCCGQMLMLDDFEEYIPFEVAWAYRVKEQGEYAILAKFRVYCANSTCAKFLHPSSHIEDTETKITYAICESDDCGALTCVKCKTLLDQGTQNHECKQDEEDAKFKQTATEKGYQECFVCGATVELVEACNHITCECGNAFCYICGKNWPGLHGCPHYGPAVYDEDGYNQDGFHRATELNREGLTRRQDLIRRRGEEDREEDDEDEVEEDEQADPEWEVLQHLTPEQRTMVNQLPHDARADALDQFRIELFENQGIHFQQGMTDEMPVQGGDDGDAEGEDAEGAAGADEEGGAGEEGAAGEDEDQDSDSSDIDEEIEDPLDDGDVFIDEDAIGGERFADDQSEDDEIAMVPDDDAEMPTLEDVPNASLPDQSDTIPATDDDAQENPWQYHSVPVSLPRDGDSEPSVDTAASYAGSNLAQHMLEDFGDEVFESVTPSPAADTPPTNPSTPPGPFTVIASNFAPGTSAADVSVVFRAVVGDELLLSTRMISASPVVMVEAKMATRQAAEDVVSTFNNQRADGRTLQVYIQSQDGEVAEPDEETAGPDEEFRRMAESLGHRQLPGPGQWGEDDEL